MTATATECAWFRELASGEIDGEVSPEEVQALDRHLATCAGCRDSRRRVRHAVRLVRALVGCGALLLVALGGGVARGQDAAPIARPVVLEQATLARSRMEHMVWADVVLRSGATTPTAVRARLVVAPPGGEQAGEWVSLDPVPPGRWVAAKLTCLQAPEFEAWRVEVEAGGRMERYVADTPGAAPRLEGEAAAAPAPSGDVVRVGARGEWVPGEPDAYLVRVRVLAPDGGDPKALLDGATVTVTARSGRRKLGATKARVDERDLRREAARVAWGRAAPGTTAWDEAQGEVVVTVFHVPDRDDLEDLQLDIEVKLAKGGRLTFERLGPPYRNDPIPPR